MRGSAWQVITLPSSDLQENPPSGVPVGGSSNTGTPTTVKHISNGDVDRFDPNTIMEEETIRIGGSHSPAESPPVAAIKEEKTPEKKGKKSKLMRMIKG